MMTGRAVEDMDVISRMRNRVRTAVVATAALAVMAISPAAAQAAFSVSGLVAQPAATDAGAHSDFTLHIAFPDTGTDVKNLTIHLPPGMVGDPTATPLCTVAQLNGDTCPANSQVGSVTTAVTAFLIPPIGIPLSVDGTLYNLTPQTGEPARFGIVLRPLGGLLGKIVLQSAVKLRTTDYGLDTVINDIPNTSNGLATHIDSMNVQLQGMAGSPAKPFMRNPTSCTVATTTFDAVSYSAATASGTASFTPTNCGSLDFSPTFLSTIGSAGHTDAGTAPPLTTIVEQDVGEAGARNVAVILPDGVAAQNAPLSRQCSVAAFQAGNCPANTIVGNATATSPLLTQPLTGPVSVVVPEVTGLPRLGLDLQGPLHIQLYGKFTLSVDGPGNEFDDVPDIPLSHFELKFAADDLVGTQRDLCVPPTPLFTTSFLGWNGATQTGDVPVTVKGCGSTGGGGKPTAKIRVSHAASKKPRMKLVVKAATGKVATKIVKTKLRLPKRLRFGHGADFANGFSVKGASNPTIRRKRRALTVKTSGTSKLVEKAARGALLRRHRIAGHKLRFKLAVKDSAGKTTHLKLKTVAKP
jgi:hypothetical protein